MYINNNHVCGTYKKICQSYNKIVQQYVLVVPLTDNSNLFYRRFCSAFQFPRGGRRKSFSKSTLKNEKQSGRYATEYRFESRDR